jgi:hypothetical protein
LRRFRAKTKTNRILALTAPTCRALPPLAPLRFAPCPPVSVFVSLPLQVKDKNSLPGGTGV